MELVQELEVEPTLALLILRPTLRSNDGPGTLDLSMYAKDLLLATPQVLYQGLRHTSLPPCVMLVCVLAASCHTSMRRYIIVCVCVCVCVRPYAMLVCGLMPC